MLRAGEYVFVVSRIVCIPTIDITVERPNIKITIIKTYNLILIY
jgi:hypothetical protein